MATKAMKRMIVQQVVDKVGWGPEVSGTLTSAKVLSDAAKSYETGC